MEIRKGWYLLRAVLRAGADVDEEDERVDKPLSLAKVEGTGCGGLDGTAANAKTHLNSHITESQMLG